VLVGSRMLALLSTAVPTARTVRGGRTYAASQFSAAHKQLLPCLLALLSGVAPGTARYNFHRSLMMEQRLRVR
jgi:hypothetical protein